MLIAQTFSLVVLGRSIKCFNSFSKKLLCPTMINIAEIKINMHRELANRPWFAKIYQIKTIFVCEPYLKTTESGY